MAWVEVELDDRTYRSLHRRAEREGISVPDLVRRITTRDAARREEGRRLVALGSLGGENRVKPAEEPALLPTARAGES